MVTAKAYDKEAVRSLSAFVKLNRAVESVSHATRDVYESKGLTVSQFGVLEALYHLGPLCQRELGEKILKSRGNISLVIKNLEFQKLITRAKRQADKRYFTVELTVKGRDMIREMFPKHAKLVKDVMSVLNKEEIDMLAKLCKKLGTQT